MNGDLKPFAPARLPDMTWEDFHKRNLGAMPGATTEQLARTFEDMQRQAIWLNDEYQVAVRMSAAQIGDVVIHHLSVKRLDKDAVHDWRDLQAIKNAIFGPEFEAVELYPAESRLVDTANQYHLWVASDAQGEPVPLPFGWHEPRAVMNDAIHGARQRPLPQETSK